MLKNSSALALIFVVAVGISVYHHLTSQPQTPAHGSTSAAAQAMQLDPYAAAGALYLAQDYDGALERYRNALRDRPGHESAAEAKYRIARCLEELGKLHEAQTAYQVFLKDYPNDTHASSARQRMAPLVGLGMTN